MLDLCIKRELKGSRKLGNQNSELSRCRWWVVESVFRNESFRTSFRVARARSTAEISFRKSLATCSKTRSQWLQVIRFIVTKRINLIRFLTNCYLLSFLWLFLTTGWGDDEISVRMMFRSIIAVSSYELTSHETISDRGQKTFAQRLEVCHKVHKSNCNGRALREFRIAGEQARVVFWKASKQANTATMSQGHMTIAVKSLRFPRFGVDVFV